MREKQQRHRPRQRHHVDHSKSPKVGNEDSLHRILDGLSVPPFLLILDQVQDPHNLGACLRSADASGVHALVMPKDRSVTITETVRNVASGAAEKLPVIQVVNLARTMDELKKAGLWLVGTSDQAGKTLYEADLTGPLAIVMGSEGKGVRRLTREKCDLLVKIPMLGSVECLNVSVATGVCLFEAVRQRQT